MSLINLANRIRPVNLRALSKFLATNVNNAPSEGSSTQKKPKTVPIPRITVISGEQVSISTLPEAQKLAKRRDLKLVKILDLDTKTQRPIYKLMTGAEYHAEDLKHREEKKKEKLTSTSIKGEKVLIVNSNISKHDLHTHCNKVTKWLAKRYEVRVVINGDVDNMEKAEEVFTTIEATLKENGSPRILQKRQKGGEIKFQIVPPKPELSKSGNDGNKSEDVKDS